MKTVLALSGSLRKGSCNTALLRAAAALAPPGLKLELATLQGIPVYDGDLEAAEGLPPAVRTLKERILAADALLLASPEYNNSLPGPLKNAIDWLSRPPKEIAALFGDKPTGLIGATTGQGGTRLAQTAWLPVLKVLGVRPFFGKSVFASNAAEAFDESGTLTDAKLRQVLQGYLKGFTTFLGVPAE